MIHLAEKIDCCGCGACAQRCPNACIDMREDKQGFLYPKVDEDKCVDCGICEKVCPVLNHGEKRKPLACFAAIHPDDKIRLASSSGGAFTALAEYVIAKNGVVFGARFNEKWEVVHDYTETVEGLAAFRGSKYVQSTIGDVYLKAEQFLKDRRQVLFTGTPCQIAGLKHFLRKGYDNLLTVEVACHGVPSPLVWREYIRKKKNITKISFRDKSTGWKNYSILIGNKRKRHYYDDYSNCFIGSFSFRLACFNCKTKYGKSKADITIADLWGISSIAPQMDDDLGTSAVVLWTEKGEKAIDQLSLNRCKISFNKFVEINSSLIKSPKKPSQYEAFWSLFLKTPQKAIHHFASFNRPPLIIQIKTTLYRILYS